MKKIFFTIAACFIFSAFSAGYAQYKLFPINTSYSTTDKTLPKSLKVQAYRNKISFSINGQPCAEFILGPGKPFPPPPPPCSPARCHELTFEHINEKVLLYIKGEKKPVTFIKSYEKEPFTSAMKNIAGNKIILTAE